MMWSPKSVANAVGGKTARACDSCVRKRARWYCAADDAFLCQSCDSAVHSANSLARRHQRLRLNSASSNSNSKPSSPSPSPSPSWLAGFTRKPRTPRPHPTTPRPNPSFSLVPDADETTSPNEIDNQEEDQLLYTVPTVDPFQLQLARDDNHSNQSKQVDSWNFHSFLPSDLDLAEFAADVETLLGRNLESECFDMEGLGLADCSQNDDTAGRSKVKVENQHEEAASRSLQHQYQYQHQDHVQVEAEVDLMRDTFELNFDDDYDVCVKNERGVDEDYVEEDRSKTKKKRKLTLRLDCEAVITAWGNHKSPWTTGERPDFDPDDAWPHSMGICGVSYGHACGEFGMTAAGDGGREARVSRYREKRRTRLFSKKIRYEVRKLNAEKRPRMKGRFVKRTPFPQPPTLPIITIKSI